MKKQTKTNHKGRNKNEQYKKITFTSVKYAMSLIFMLLVKIIWFVSLVISKGSI